MNLVRPLASSLFALSFLAAVAVAKEVDTSKLPPPSTRTGVTFDTDIKPVFQKSCVECHGPKKAKGKLRLDSLPGVLKGSEDGKVVVPGDSAKSALVHSVALPVKKAMPPKGKGTPLAKEDVALIRAWIDQGVK